MESTITQAIDFEFEKRNFTFRDYGKRVRTKDILAAVVTKLTQLDFDGAVKEV